MSALPEVRTFTFAGESRVAVRGTGVFKDKWYVNGPILGSRVAVHESLLDEDRPLVVIDPEDRKAVENLRNLMDDAYKQQEGADIGLPTAFAARGNALQAALRSLLAPPRPDEPTGLGAVVEDVRGRHWVLRSTSATLDRFESDGIYKNYADIAAVKVLSEGVA